MAACVDDDSRRLMGHLRVRAAPPALVVVLTVLLLASVLPGVRGLGLSPAAAAGGPACLGQGDNDHVSGISATQRPVVLVHGWDGDKTAMDAVKKHLSVPAGVGPMLAFDYGRNSQHWASIPAIAACLADYLNAVSATYHNAGGDGKVLVVAHSMGGLATRFATDSRYAANPAAAAVGGLITLDTPALGSPWGDQTISRLAEATIGKHPSALWPAPAGQDGSICLAPHDQQRRVPAGCAVAPYLPPDASVSQVVGQITVRRTLFGIHLYDINLDSDAIVPSESSGGYPGSGPVDDSGSVPRAAKHTGGATTTATVASCVTTADAITHVLATGLQAGAVQVTHPLDLFSGAWSFLSSQDLFSLGDLANQKYGPNLMVLLLGAELSAPCSHGNILSYGPALAAVHDSLAAMDTTLNARHPAPANCGPISNRLGDVVNVRIVSGDISCQQAIATARGYDALPDNQLAGSGGAGQVGAYFCISTSGTDYQQTGHASDCTSGVNHISLDRPPGVDCGSIGQGVVTDVIASGVDCTLAREVGGSVYAGDSPPGGFRCTSTGPATFGGVSGTGYTCQSDAGTRSVRVLLGPIDPIGSGSAGASLCQDATGCYAIHADGGSVNVRNDANTSAGILATLRDGQQVSARCRTLGETVSGPEGTTDYWDAIKPSGVISDAFIGAASQLPDC